MTQNNPLSSWQVTVGQAPILWSVVSEDLQIDFSVNVDGVEGIEYHYLLLSIQLWDDYWQRDECLFVPSEVGDFPRHCCHSDAIYQQALTEHRFKIQRWQPKIAAGEPIPAVCFADTAPNERLKIKQGRHRIVALRQQGVPVFAAAIPKHLAARFQAFLSPLPRC